MSSEVAADEIEGRTCYNEIKYDLAELATLVPNGNDIGLEAKQKLLGDAIERFVERYCKARSVSRP